MNEGYECVVLEICPNSIQISFSEVFNMQNSNPGKQKQRQSGFEQSAPKIKT